MIFEVHRCNQLPMWFYNWRKNKPNKLKKVIRNFYFFKPGRSACRKACPTVPNAVKLLINRLYLIDIMLCFSMFDKYQISQKK